MKDRRKHFKNRANWRKNLINGHVSIIENGVFWYFPEVFVFIYFRYRRRNNVLCDFS